MSSAALGKMCLQTLDKPLVDLGPSFLPLESGATRA